MALAGGVAVGLALDARTLDGVPVWLKPLKFGVSNALFAFTLAWILAWLDDRPRLVARAGWGVALALTLENVLIALQAWRGVHSHFNATTPLDAAIVSLMGAAMWPRWCCPRRWHARCSGCQRQTRCFERRAWA